MRVQFCVAVLLGTCTAPTSSVPLDQDFELRPGQTVKIAGTGQSITFEAVAEDSRCPASVQCVWAGNARVSLRVGEGGRDSVLTLNTGVEPRRVSIGKISLELKAVTPGPSAGTATPASTYRVTLHATGA